MAKKLNISYEDKNYTLEFSSDTVVQMEKRGFLASELTEKPMSLLPELFAGAFQTNHPNASRKTINAIFDKLPNKHDLVGKLIELYNEPVEALFEEPEDGGIEWTASW